MTVALRRTTTGALRAEGRGHGREVLRQGLQSHGGHRGPAGGGRCLRLRRPRGVPGGVRHRGLRVRLIIITHMVNSAVSAGVGWLLARPPLNFRSSVARYNSHERERAATGSPLKHTAASAGRAGAQGAACGGSVLGGSVRRVSDRDRDQHPTNDLLIVLTFLVHGIASA